MRAWISLLLVLAALAGCLGDDSTDEHDHDDHEHEDDAMDDLMNETVNNTAPTALLVSSNQAVTVPTDINFTVNATDAEGDDLDWTLDVDGDGTADTEGTLVAVNGTYTAVVFTYSYTVNGTYNVTLNMTDGEFFAEATTQIVAEDAPDGGGEGDGNETAEADFEDRGWYLFDPATGMCHVKDYVDIEGLGILYNSPLSGGDWYILEDNDVPGLQIANNHPEQASGNFSLDIPDCVDGDQVVL